MAASKLFAKPKHALKRKMSFVPYFKAEFLPAADMLVFTNEVNKLIESYNGSKSKSQKIKVLNSLRAKIREVEHTYNPSYFAKSPSFLKAHNKLFKEVQYQYYGMNASPVLDKSTPLSSLSRILDNISPAKANKLLALLAQYKGDQDQLINGLRNLYKTTDKRIEAKAFRKFLREHQISFLGGENSKNFKVARLDGSEAEVLKVDYRLDASRRAESHLRHHVGDRLTPMYADRQATYVAPPKDPKKSPKTVCRTLLVTRYCHGGGLDAFAQALDTPKRLAVARSVFEQMARTLLRLQEAGCCFPDSKLSNWLIDGGKVQIADTKSFLFINRDGLLDQKSPQNKDAPFIDTKGYRPPEYIDNDDPLDAEPAHAYILGLNLYEFITGEEAKEEDSSPVEFKQALFATEKGRQYRNLIEALIRPEPSERMSLNEVCFNLFKISDHPVFDELNALKFGKNDPEMDKFIAKKMKEIQDTKTIDELTEILEGLKTTVLRLKADQALTPVKPIAKDIRISTTGFFAPGMKLMAQAPIEKRIHFKELSVVKADMDVFSL